MLPLPSSLPPWLAEDVVPLSRRLVVVTMVIMLYYDYVLILLAGNVWICSLFLRFWFMLILYLFFFAWEVCLGMEYFIIIIMYYIGWIKKARRGMYVCLISVWVRPVCT
jgi:hypothetical protein